MSKYIPTSVNETLNTITITLDCMGGIPKIIKAANRSELARLVTAANNGDVETLKAAIDKVSGVKKYTNGKVYVQNNTIYYNDQPVENYLGDKIVRFMNAGLDFNPLMKHLEKLLNGNTNKRAVEEGHKFLEHKGLTITEDGNFIAYRGLLPDMYSRSAGSIIPLKGTVREVGKGNYQIYNGVGEEIEVERNQVDAEKNHFCAQGLHVGTYEYAKDWAGHNGVVVAVEVDPANIVSVPLDCGCQKMRVCAYTVKTICERVAEDCYVRDVEAYFNNENYSDILEEELEVDEDVEILLDDAYEEGYCDGHDHGFLDGRQISLAELAEKFSEGYTYGKTISAKRSSRNSNS